MSKLNFSAFDENSLLASLELSASEFESFLAVNGQDCLWLQNTPLADQDAHNRSGRSLAGVRADGRDTSWPTQTDWRTVTASRLSENLYQTGIPITACRPPAEFARPRYVRSLTDEREIQFGARTALTYDHRLNLDATEPGRLELPTELGAQRDQFQLSDSNGDTLEVVGHNAANRVVLPCL